MGHATDDETGLTFMSAQLYDNVDLRDMIPVPAGVFSYGVSPQFRDALMNDADPLADSLPAESVYLEDFWIDRTPVTYHQYRAFVADTGYMPAMRKQSRAWESSFLDYLWNPDRTFQPGLEKMPVVFVTWYDALAYSEWAGKTLPTEVEWEKAARGTDSRRFPWGDDPDHRRYCNCPKEFHPKNVIPLTEVDSFPQGSSPYGCLDMMGNAQEWCWDSYFQNAPVGQDRRMRLQPPLIEEYGAAVRSAGRAVRGGGRLTPAVHVAQRAPMDPWVDSPYIGFRCVWHPSSAS